MPDIETLVGAWRLLQPAAGARDMLAVVQHEQGLAVRQVLDQGLQGRLIRSAPKSVRPPPHRGDALRDERLSRQGAQRHVPDAVGPPIGVAGSSRPACSAW